MNITADHLEFNKSYEISALKENDLTQKLAEMGCVPGTEIMKLYTAPGGDPIAFRIDSYILGLRKSEAENIFVIPTVVEN
jgi:ferrous iron transport protein A